MVGTGVDAQTSGSCFFMKSAHNLITESDVLSITFMFPYVNIDDLSLEKSTLLSYHKQKL